MTDLMNDVDRFLDRRSRRVESWTKTVLANEGLDASGAEIIRDAIGSLDLESVHLPRDASVFHELAHFAVVETINAFVTARDEIHDDPEETQTRAVAILFDALDRICARCDDLLPPVPSTQKAPK